MTEITHHLFVRERMNIFFEVLKNNRLQIFKFDKT
ncbi:hypothetical protein FIC_01625 [Flavobacteriaceae bacterium 3519-10]|nr:hypothetical protein FIC_01625 [Flavobacteriaceae bacterium 3519-10]